MASKFRLSLRKQPYVYLYPMQKKGKNITVNSVFRNQMAFTMIF